MEKNTAINKYLPWIIIGVIFISLFFVANSDYLVFHFITEMFTIVIAGTVFVITLNTRKYFVNQYMVFIGITYLFIALLDMFHTMTYTGMPIYTHLNYPANQLWIAARYYESIMLLLGFSYIYGRSVDIKKLIIINILITAAILSSILVFEIFPDCYIEGSGLTPFKIISEYIISSILIIAMVFIWQKRRDFNKRQYLYLNIALITTIVSELLFTFYISNYGISNIFGHYFKVLSFIFIYLLIIKEGLQDPYSMIFKELEENRLELQHLADRDPLTKLLNRRSLTEQFERNWKSARRENKELSILLLDVDDFKICNDTYGHSFGDEILVLLSEALTKTVHRPLDLISRHGGEEFVVVLYDCSFEGATQKAADIHKAIHEMSLSLKEDIVITVSIGYVTTIWNEDLNLQKLLIEADHQLYEAKNTGKHKTCGKQL
jgi:diguanylate cyclase (GGDEF)-like protein